MPTMDIDLTNVPTTIPVIGSGIVEFEVKEVEVTLTKGDPTKNKAPEPMYVFKSVVHTDGPDKGRSYTDRALPGNQFGPITIKRMALSCGLPLTGLTTEMFVGKVWKGNVSTKIDTYQGRQREINNVEILIPGDTGF